ncbi:hypothetical protein FHW18_004396 [Pigmentiphaga litoralis]|uniref:Uncharacterized protein n=1 Tax=Pigmentiphaga litoralis TaxID=516702 RepID=A0A7Y9IY23_9BURK|nr:hypothetical protein [Pigmentiphaga litoralis]NYE85089.1 hypothetical protein [Pigmentiphaga litoralis]
MAISNQVVDGCNTLFVAINKVMDHASNVVAPSI